MPQELETKRLVLRSLRPDDYIEAFKWCGDPIANRFMLYPLYEKAEDVIVWLETLDPDDPDKYDYGFVLKETGELIGSGGMYFDPRKDLWSIGYNIRRDMWNRGLTTEAMRALIAHVRGLRDVKAIEAEFAIDNPASGRVMEKLGLRYVRDTQYTKFDGSASFKARIYRIDYPI